MGSLNYNVLIFLFICALMIERGDIRFRTGQQNKIIEAVYGMHCISLYMYWKPFLTRSTLDFDVAVKLLELRLGLSKESNISDLLNQAMGNNIGHGISSRVTSTTATAAIFQGGKVKRVSSFALAEGRKRLSSGDDAAEDDENFWNELDDMNGQPKAENDLAMQDVPVRGKGSGHSNRPQSRTALAQVLPPAQRREAEEQLAETLYKRAQAKMMLPIHEDSVIESALMDAWRVSRFSQL